MNPSNGNSPAVKLLVVDDDPKNLKFINFILAGSGLEIHTTTDPQAGLEMARRLRPQIVLSDLVLPGMKEMELLEKIVQLDPQIQVILMTGHGSPELKAKAIEKGAVDFFQKPFSPEKLRQRIALLVDDAKLRQPASGASHE